MNPIQFALQDKAVHDFIRSSSNSSDISIWGWVALVAIVLILASCFFKLYKKDKKSENK